MFNIKQCSSGFNVSGVRFGAYGVGGEYEWYERERKAESSERGMMFEREREREKERSRERLYSLISGLTIYHELTEKLTLYKISTLIKLSNFDIFHLFLLLHKCVSYFKINKEYLRYFYADKGSKAIIVNRTCHSIYRNGGGEGHLKLSQLNSLHLKLSLQCTLKT